MDRLMLTFAELTFLLGRGTADGAVALRAVGLPDLIDDERVVSAGLASLVARELLVLDGDDRAQGHGALAAVAASLGAATTRVTIGHSNEETQRQSIIKIVSNGESCMSIAPVGAMCFEFEGIKAGTSLSDLVEEAVAAALVEPAGGRVVVAVERDDVVTSFVVEREGSVHVVQRGDGSSVVAADVGELGVALVG